MIYRTRPRQLAYGRPIGILMLEETIPCPPGTVGNPTTFSFPVCYEVVRGTDIGSLKNLNVPDGFPAFLAAAERLVERGACAITGNCGLMIVHQTALAAALPVPVLLSSLLQLPAMARLFGPQAAIGIMAYSRSSMKPGHVMLAAGDAQICTVLATMDEQPHFCAAIGQQSGLLDTARAEAEAVAVARAMVAEHPDVRAILFECTDLPPYAAAVQDAVELPVFDITTLINSVASALMRKPFSGIY